MQDLEKTIASQFANSPTILQLIANMNQYIVPATDFANFVSFVWDVDTAQDWGLDIWGRIVGVSRVIPIPGTEGSFGFANADVPADWQNWGNVNQPGTGGPFFAGQTSTGSFTLNDTAYRTLILAKALANIAATTAPALNQLVTNLFPGRGRAYTQDGRDMTMTYVFEFSLSSIEFAILSFSGVLPHPGGVLTKITVVPVDSGFFGFSEMGAGVVPFGFGVFAG
jgi:hypothetical protein